MFFTGYFHFSKGLIYDCVLYIRFQNEIAGKPQGHINLNNQTRIARTESSLTFEVWAQLATIFTLLYYEHVDVSFAHQTISTCTILTTKNISCRFTLQREHTTSLLTR